MSSKPQKLDPRVIRTRQMLRNALIELIGEKGFSAITVQDITQRATLNRATFYLHYRDKEDLLAQSVEEILKELVTGMKECRIIDYDIADSDGNVVQPLPDLVYVFEHVAKHEKFYRVMLGKKGQQSFWFRLMDVFVNVLDSRLEQSMTQEIQPKVPKEILIHYAASAYLGVISWWLKNDMPYSPHDMAKHLTRLRVQHLQIPPLELPPEPNG
ncbi:TetR/AcrR family transcriptional regulator [Polycladomyces subterraneus]|uniref:TetR/AcrR family transcriptional regulator n=1 Tax=Polycladomyces subterraneus TaxID=1016997 RepID=A0ABT8ILP3_9BACL|nr:TetR/AcrR family transcriptional regulator [Polycladomyces subterraneus]MDN4593707.1 TetR/AcrR family transcriptional regulator [Polycladomyces subterraneus]